MLKNFRLFVLILLIASVKESKAQQSSYTDFYSKIKNYDLSNLWHTDSLLPQDEKQKVAFPEPIGFIGENFQRFYIHYASVTKNKRNPYVYDVTGKTKVKNNICQFKGRITILEANLFKEREGINFKEGAVNCKIDFDEDSTEN